MFFRIILIYFLLSSFFLEGKPLNISVNAESAILINADTGTILFEKNAHQPLYPASITKIATAIYTLKVRGNKLDKILKAEHDAVASISENEMIRSNYTLPSHWLIPGASHIGIKRGEELSLKDLLYGTMLASGGDACNVIAQYIGGTIPTFMKLVNEYLQEIGCENTVFKNPHGLHHPEHVTTAYDMSLLAREAMKDPTFREIVKTVKYTRPQTNKQSPTTLIQGNRLLRRGKFYYPKAIGVKTGYTSKAQNTIVAAAKEGDRTLIAVLMKCKEREVLLNDAKEMFEVAFNEKKITKQLLPKGPQKAILKLPNASKKIKSLTKNAIVLDYYPSEVSTVQCLVQWDQLELPISKDQRIGLLCIKDKDDRIHIEEPLYALEDVNYSIPYRMKQFLTGSVWIKIIGVGVVLLMIIGFLLIGRQGSY